MRACGASFESERRAKVAAVALPATERRLAELRAARESSIEAAAPAALPDGEIQFAADVNFQAGDDAKEGTPPAKSFAMHAYGGGLMRVAGYQHQSQSIWQARPSPVRTSPSCSTIEKMHSWAKAA